jgi:putative phosphoribosyl transferase
LYNNNSSSYRIFENREDAARLLGDKLSTLMKKRGRSINKKLRGGEEIDEYASNQILVIAIPRGGVITGDIIASSLGAKLDIVVSRKIVAPFNSELAIGAVMHDGTFYPNEDIINMLNISEDYIDQQKALQMKEIERRLIRFRGSKEYWYGNNLQDKTIILVDDGIATGATMFAAIKWIRKQKPKKIIVAVPVGPKETIEKLSKEEGVDKVVVLNSPLQFQAVGQFYKEFSQVSDDAVVKVMQNHRQKDIAKSKKTTTV